MRVQEITSRNPGLQHSANIVMGWMLWAGRYFLPFAYNIKILDDVALQRSRWTYIATIREGYYVQVSKIYVWLCIFKIQDEELGDWFVWASQEQTMFRTLYVQKQWIGWIGSRPYREQWKGIFSMRYLSQRMMIFYLLTVEPLWVMFEIETRLLVLRRSLHWRISLESSK